MEQEEEIGLIQWIKEDSFIIYFLIESIEYMILLVYYYFLIKTME